MLLAKVVVPEAVVSKASALRPLPLTRTMGPVPDELRPGAEGAKSIAVLPVPTLPLKAELERMPPDQFELSPVKTMLLTPAPGVPMSTTPGPTRLPAKVTLPEATVPLKPRLPPMSTVPAMTVELLLGADVAAGGNPMLKVTPEPRLVLTRGLRVPPKKLKA